MWIIDSDIIKDFVFKAKDLEPRPRTRNSKAVTKDMQKPLHHSDIN